MAHASMTHKYKVERRLKHFGGIVRCDMLGAVSISIPVKQHCKQTLVQSLPVRTSYNHGHSGPN